MKKILIYRWGGLGDTLLVFPVLEVFKKLGNQIVLSGNSDYIELARLANFADEVYSGEFLELLLKRDFDQRIIISNNGNLKPFPNERIWLPLYYLQSLNLPPFFSKTLFLNLSTREPLNLAVLHPGSGSPKKNPSLNLFKKIEGFLSALGYEVIYLGGEAESWLLSQIKKNLFISSNLLDTIKLLLSAKIYIGNDSGISHLASYLGIESYVFFGPSDEIIFHPIGERVHIISLNLSCRPCFPRVCPQRFCLDERLLFQKFVQSFKDRKN